MDLTSGFEQSLRNLQDTAVSWRFFMFGPRTHSPAALREWSISRAPDVSLRWTPLPSSLLLASGYDVPRQQRRPVRGTRMGRPKLPTGQDFRAVLRAALRALLTPCRIGRIASTNEGLRFGGPHRVR